LCFKTEHLFGFMQFDKFKDVFKKRNKKILAQTFSFDWIGALLISCVFNHSIFLFQCSSHFHISLKHHFRHSVIWDRIINILFITLYYVTRKTLKNWKIHRYIKCLYYAFILKYTVKLWTEFCSEIWCKFIERRWSLNCTDFVKLDRYNKCLRVVLHSIERIFSYTNNFKTH